jgi:hypothetical protein
MALEMALKLRVAVKVQETLTEVDGAMLGSQG